MVDDDAPPGTAPTFLTPPAPPPGMQAPAFLPPPAAPGQLGVGALPIAGMHPSHASAPFPGVVVGAPATAPTPAPPGYPDYSRLHAIAAEIDLDALEDDGSFNPLLDPNYASLQLAIAQATERDPDGAAAWYQSLCDDGPRAMAKKIVEGIVPGMMPGMGAARVGGMARAVPGGAAAAAAAAADLPQRPNAAHCIEFQKTGGCSYGKECPYHHPIGGV